MIKYVERILDSIEKKGVNTEKKSLRQIKDEIENLEISEQLIIELDSSLDKFRKDKKVFNEVLQLKMLLSELKEKSIIIDNLASFAYYLAILKVTTLNKEFKTTKRIISKFLNQKDIKLSVIISEINAFDSKINHLDLSFKNLHNAVHSNLEDKVEFDKTEHGQVKKLKAVVSKQKELAYNLGLMFCELMTVLIKDKEYRSFMT